MWTSSGILCKVSSLFARGGEDVSKGSQLLGLQKLALSGRWGFYFAKERCLFFEWECVHSWDWRELLKGWRGFLSIEY